MREWMDGGMDGSGNGWIREWLGKGDGWMREWMDQGHGG